MVSVIIPVYNAECTLRKCVESLVFGAYRDIEVVLVDDCSTDKSWDICRDLSLSFDKVKCFRNEVNSGVSFTRNHGLEKVRGELIAFVDSDDWVSGQYLLKLTECFDLFPGSFIISGHHFINKTEGTSRDYLWKPEQEGEVYNVPRSSLFDLADAFLLQQVWNKLFIKEVIDRNGIEFDVNQSMGEDYLFVLDYIEKAGVQSCTVVNLPLYYYIRANDTSLMSKFGLTNISKDFERLEKLKDLCGESIEIKEKYEQAVNRAKNNAVYHIFRNSSINQQEKKSLITEIIGADALDQVLQKEQIRHFKEKVYRRITRLNRVPETIKNKLTRQRNRMRIIDARKKLQKKGFTIISQNCIGGVFYNDMKKQFMSPTINLYFPALDFLTFVNDLDHYLSVPLVMEWKEQYPIGHLDQLTIYFQHYDTCTEALEAWERRKKRILHDQIIVLATDRDGFKDEYMSLWDQIKFTKILFSSKKRTGEGVLYYKKWRKQGEVGNLMADRSFYKKGKLITAINKL